MTKVEILGKLQEIHDSNRVDEWRDLLHTLSPQSR